MNALREAFSGTVFGKRKRSQHLAGLRKGLAEKVAREAGLVI